MPKRKPSVIARHKHGLPIRPEILGQEFEGFIEPEEFFERMKKNSKQAGRYSEDLERFVFTKAKYEKSKSIGELIELLEAIPLYRESLTAMVKEKWFDKIDYSKYLEADLIDLNHFDEKLYRLTIEIIRKDFPLLPQRMRDYNERHTAFLDEKNSHNARELIYSISLLKKSLRAKILSLIIEGETIKANKEKVSFDALGKVETYAQKYARGK